MKAKQFSDLTEAEIDEYFNRVPPQTWAIYNMIVHALHQTDEPTFESELAMIQDAIRAEAKRRNAISTTEKT